MSLKSRQALAIVSACVLVVGVLAAAGITVWRDLSPYEREVLEPILNPRLGLLIMIGLVGAGMAAVMMKSFVQANLAAPALLADELGLIVGTDPSRRLKPTGSPELQRIAESVNLLADQRRSLQEDVELRVREARLSVEEERNRLAALMSELNQSVVVCNLDGRILLYNNRARLQFKALSDAPTAAGGGEIIGLGRSIYMVFERSLIVHALESIQERIRRESSQPVANFVTTTRAGQLLRVQMAPVLSAVEGEAESVVSGFVLMLDNITRNFEAETKRDQMLHTLTEGSRSSLANLRAAAEMLEYPDLDAELKDRFLKVVRDEVQGMSVRLDDTANAFADSLKTRWPLDEMLGADLIAAAQRRVEKKLGLPTKLEDVDPAVWVKVDSFSLLQAISYLASRLSDEFEVREVRFRLTSAGRLVHLDLIWSGQAMSTETVMAWELEPMTFAGESSPLTVRDVIARHDGEIWLQREKTQHRAFFRLLLPSAAPQDQVQASTYLKQDSRPEYYDFDLFKQTEVSRELDDRLLAELAFTVFDTETTGLNPSEGDEIIQIGATRIVNGKLLKSESFDQLVDPLRELPEASTKIHGITPEMLLGQPPMSKVLPAFHAFAEDTVLVAHNAAFDMRFLQLKEESSGIRFAQPVLDTLLLSAVIHPAQESHRLEAICERMGVNIMGRHTAIGDAIVTGEVFLRMIPLLAEMGIRTLGEARRASEKTYYARVKY
ncbi:MULTISPECIES: exonuclease domain-containing protein [Zoogloea]|jgi:DNA polymerase-3 subunit epsilon|uniref:DNA-directed DNA polymerase n=1 Tax=Zoogloea oleivorans TaxID=1552750 RepID=A0A6C2CKQ0_9RHOO|nr:MULTISPECIES: exonuclease domain-containing protein [Zoogloea]MBT9497267.1 DNA polymerase III subunit epsilon [Zoogloea sp.]MDD2666986.1 exonuclease domain-containing protein [Zoogloea sp.]MDY0037386.1 exonuclease domain-containing protein [Zoogloea oleivorans]TYC54561.1 DNA polymerase III subunit epsilon [Zoogloea oleivorans]